MVPAVDCCAVAVAAAAAADRLAAATALQIHTCAIAAPSGHLMEALWVSTHRWLTAAGQWRAWRLNEI
jgi:hypothetical protein